VPLRRNGARPNSEAFLNTRRSSRLRYDLRIDLVMWRLSVMSRTLAAIAIAMLFLATSGLAGSRTGAATLPLTPTPWAESAVEVVKHSTPGATCGISSGNFARSCRPGIYNRCINAVARKVEGFTAERCERERNACSTCLQALHKCIGRIGHVIGTVTRSTCASCTARLSVCLDRSAR
jgi:hypothetical protein